MNECDDVVDTRVAVNIVLFPDPIAKLFSEWTLESLQEEKELHRGRHDTRASRATYLVPTT